ncbi:histidine kinase [Candidatus Endoriftia persephone str. Guaymas]|nr:histidine kinase [Candidatus Endoriftia persephone str. Guaymas]
MSRIPRERKREAWEKLQRDYPAQAELVESEFVQEMAQAFDGEIVIYLPETVDRVSR